MVGVIAACNSRLTFRVNVGSCFSHERSQSQGECMSSRAEEVRHVSDEGLLIMLSRVLEGLGVCLRVVAM